jgi:Bax protein
MITTVFISCNELDYRYEVRVQHVHLDSLSQIIPVTDSIVIPALYDTLLINNLLSISEKKQQFINQVLPAILIVKFNEHQKYERIKLIISQISKGEKPTKIEQQFLDSLIIRYNADTNENLLTRLKPHPTSLVLAQAAIESGWGQSRFAIEGNNLFGIVATPNDAAFQKSKLSSGGRRISVKKYDTVEESIEHYFFTIGKNQAYRSFRIKRFEEAKVNQLIDELHKYSVKGDEYSKMLKQIIIWNDLTKYDNCKIDANYIADRKCLCYLTKQLFVSHSKK